MGGNTNDTDGRIERMGYGSPGLIDDPATAHTAALVTGHWSLFTRHCPPGIPQRIARRGVPGYSPIVYSRTGIMVILPPVCQMHNTLKVGKFDILTLL